MTLCFQNDRYKGVDFLKALEVHNDNHSVFWSFFMPGAAKLVSVQKGEDCYCKGKVCFGY